MKRVIMTTFFYVLAGPLGFLFLGSVIPPLAISQEIIVHDFQINENGGSASQHSVDVARNGSGEFVMVWVDSRNGRTDIYGQRFSSDGTPLGDNVRINDDVGVASQSSPSVAIDNSGNFVVAWQDDRDGEDDNNIYAQRYSSDGTPLGDNFKVNDDNTQEPQYYPSIAASSSGAFVVTWQDNRGDDSDIYAQRFASDGTALGSNFLVNDDPAGENQDDASIAADASGNFVIAWEDRRDGDANIYAQRYAADGTAQGSNFRVDDDPGTDRQYYPSVAYDGLGDFAITWKDFRGLDAIYAQRYAGDGTPQGVNFEVTEDIGTTSPNNPSISKDATGKFVITWHAFLNSHLNIYAQRFDSDGTPLGGNFLVNDDPGEVYQQNPSVSLDSNGNFVIAWHDSRNIVYDIYAQLYSSDGSALGSNFIVNQDPGSAHQSLPSIALVGSGDFVIAWEDERDGFDDIYAQRCSGDGTALGTNFLVNDNSIPSRQSYPSVSGDTNGNFVVAWQDQRNSGSLDIYAQRYDSDGNPLGINWLVNDDGGGTSQYYPSVAMNSSGRFVVTWHDNRNGDNDIYAQRYDTDGSPLGVNFMVNDDGGSENQEEPAVAIADDGGFVIAWEDRRDGGRDIFMQRFSADGTPQGANTKVNDDMGTSSKNSPDVSIDGDGNFVIAWEDNRSGMGDIYAQRYAANGSPLGMNFLVNDDVAEVYQGVPSVAAEPGGNFVIAWYDDRNEENNYDVYAQRYDSDGVAIGSNFLIAETEESIQWEPDVKLWNERIYSAWSDTRVGGTGYDIWANVRDWEGPAGVGNETAPSMPFAARLGQNYPNPFNPSTTLSFEIPGIEGEQNHTSLKIYDLRGRCVRTLVDSGLPPGSHSVHWDGRNDAGERVSSGIYLYSLQVGDEAFARKMTLVK
jgi:hypothetical protein